MGLFQGRFGSVAARSVTAAVVSLAVLGAATSAQAAVVFDFIAAAAGNEGPFDNTAAYATVGGITVQAFASNTFGDGTISVPYLDDVAFNPPRPGGLGVCSDGLSGSGQCITPSDDNVTSGETLRLEFFSDTLATNPKSVTINPTFFRNADHFAIFSEGALIDIRIDDAIAGFTTFPLVANFTTSLTGITFDFRYNNEEFYIQSLTVPLPAALPLFLSALAGLALMGRRQRKKVAA